MEAVLTSEETRRIDEYTSRIDGIETAELMERAARAAKAQILAHHFDEKPVLIVCGMGNNGADGLALARMLRTRDMDVRLVTIGSRERATALWQRQMKNLQGVSEYHIEGACTGADRSAVREKLAGTGLIVDAVFGVGLARPLAGAYAEVIGLIDEFLKEQGQMRPMVAAVDMPSGISADTGAVLGTALCADMTVTFGYRKCGQLLYPGAMYCGELIVADIGFADFLRAFGKPACMTGDRALLKKLPMRRADTNKGSYGRLLVAAGSDGMAGAALLSAAAGYRTGCGLVYVLTPEENRVVLQSRLPEAVYICRGQQVRGQLIGNSFSAAVAGPGISRDAKAKELLSAVLEALKIPLVLDADALNLIAEDEKLAEAVKGYAHGVIMTPHRAEMARLLKCSIEDLKSDPVGTARMLSERFGCVCVAKDARTVVYGPGRGAYICTAGNDGMATGGSGDVLAGIIGGLLAQDTSDLYMTAVLGVSVHAWAGDAAAARLGTRYMLARDIIEGMSEVLK